jgi:hypothetical protein
MKYWPHTWITRNSMFLYRGDWRLRLLRATWSWHGLDDRRWEVSFEKGPYMGSDIDRSFTKALVVAAWRTYTACWADGRPRRARCFDSIDGRPLTEVDADKAR